LSNNKAEDFKLIKSAKKKQRAKVIMSETAILKMVGLVMSFRSEVGWHGTARRLSGNEFTVDDVYVYPQDASAASVDTDQWPYEQWLYSLPNEIFNTLRMHGHSHYIFDVIPSSRDVNHRNKIVEQLVGDMFYMFIIWNKNLNIHILIYDRITGFIYENKNIDLFVSLDGKSVPIKDMQLNDIKAMLVNDEIGKFLNDAKGIVKKPACVMVRDTEMFSLFSKFEGQNIRVRADKNNNHLIFADEGGTEILCISGEENFVRFTWSIDDVKAVRPDLTDNECMNVLERVKSEYDTSIGVSWATVEIHAGELYPKLEPVTNYGKAVRNAIETFIASKYDGKENLICEVNMTLDGNEIKSKVVLAQGLDKNRLYHYWYGGHAAEITVSVNGKDTSASIEATGDIRAYLYDKDNTALCNIKDKSNNAGFYDMSQYISDDNFLKALLEHKDNERGLSLQIEDNNWWELFPDSESDSTVVLDDYSLPDVIGDAAEILYGKLLKETKGDCI
jgi:hypothetical protein